MCLKSTDDVGIDKVFKTVIDLFSDEFADIESVFLLVKGWNWARISNGTFDMLSNEAEPKEFPPTS